MLKLIPSMVLFQVGNCEHWIVREHTKETAGQQSDTVGGRNQFCGTCQAGWPRWLREVVVGPLAPSGGR